MKGLLGRRGLAVGEGLLLQPASAIHTWFMRFPIASTRSCACCASRKGSPWRFASAWGARSVLELPAGAAALSGVRAGEQLTAAYY